jgi:hypothetical protein
MEFTIYRRHLADCDQTADRYAPRCGCPLWFQFNWKQASTSLDGNKLKRGCCAHLQQNREVWSGC